MPVAPALMVGTKRTLPDTPTTPTQGPPGRRDSAYPRLIELPRPRSSRSRSVSLPVRSVTSAALP